MTNYFDLKKRNVEHQVYEAWVVLDGIATFTGQSIGRQQLPPNIQFDNGIAMVNDGHNMFLISPHIPSPVIDIVTDLEVVKET